MIRTVLFAAFAGIIILFSLFIVLIPYGVLQLLGMKSAAAKLLGWGAVLYGKALITWSGSRVEVRGLERFPRNAQRLCVVANHQSLFDIPLLAGYLPVKMGFIAKKELSRIPVLNLWLIALGSVLIDRRRRRSAIEAITRGVERIRAGVPLALFPEGTRSRGVTMGRFKPGSLKLALRAEAVIVPVTIDGTYLMYEGHGKIRPASITLTVHDPVATENMPEESQKRLADQLEETVRGGLQPAAQQRPADEGSG
jgi:1-acyl-sn-glycerol-3-phosphate acyltransferase